MLRWGFLEDVTGQSSWNLQVWRTLGTAGERVEVEEREILLRF